jgi:outer membrane protein OmpA-like peptidoglycan-associated protein
MNKPALSLLLFILLSNSSFVLAKEGAIPKQLQQIESLQRRADKLAFGALGADNYHLAKARTWLDLALSEYYESEGSGIVPSAIEQAETLLDSLEKKQAVISMDTPMLLPGSEAVRPDLWSKLATLKKHDKFSCGQRAIAEAEVHLVWAGHEKFESGWSHAESYARSAEDLVKEAQTSINTCAARIPAIEKITLSSTALFGFDEAKLEPSELWRLNRLTDSIKTAKSLEEVVLVGHTDRLRTDGHQERNQILSEKRAESIKKYLIGKGIAADKIHASGAGSSQPLVQCSTKQRKEKQVACLQPNRRVEIVLHSAK